MEEYQSLYSDFMKAYASGTTTSENVGELIARLAGYYPNYNMALAKAERSLALVARDEALVNIKVNPKKTTVDEIKNP